MNDPILDLCQKIHGWDGNSPYEILEAKKMTADNKQVVTLIVEVRSKKEEEEEK